MLHGTFKHVDGGICAELIGNIISVLKQSVSDLSVAFFPVRCERKAVRIL